jgi:hypothetical protein
VPLAVRQQHPKAVQQVADLLAAKAQKDLYNRRVRDGRYPTPPG